MFQEVQMDMPSNIQEATGQVDRLRANMGECRGELREMEYILYRTTSIMSRLGLPPQVQQTIQTIERAIMMVRILHSAMIYLEMGTPLGWILGLLSVTSFGISLTTEFTTAYDQQRGKS
jgi:hypothetical protein